MKLTFLKEFTKNGSYFSIVNWRNKVVYKRSGLNSWLRVIACVLIPIGLMICMSPIIWAEGANPKLNCDLRSTHYSKSLDSVPFLHDHIILKDSLSSDRVDRRGRINLYAYVGNNSPNAVDPLGLAIISVNRGYKNGYKKGKCPQGYVDAMKKVQQKLQGQIDKLWEEFPLDEASVLEELGKPWANSIKIMLKWKIRQVSRTAKIKALDSIEWNVTRTIDWCKNDPPDTKDKPPPIPILPILEDLGKKIPDPQNSSNRNSNPVATTGTVAGILAALGAAAALLLAFP